MNNALKNGLLPVALDAEAHAVLVQARELDPGLEVHVDLQQELVRFRD